MIYQNNNKNMWVPPLRCADTPNMPKNAIFANFARDLWKNGARFWTFDFRNGFSDLKLCKNAVHSLGTFVCEIC